LAAKETATKIDESVAKSNQGAQISAEVAQSLDVIQQQVLQLDQLVGEIAFASGEQNQGISQVSLAVTQMDQVTQSNAASAEETAAASQDLNSQASVLSDAVQSLQALVGGNASNNAQPIDEVANDFQAARPNSAPAARKNTFTSRR